MVIGLVLAVARNSELNQAAWNDLLVLTGFTLLVALFSIIVVKIMAGPLQKMGLISGSLVAFFVLLLVVVGVYEMMIFALYKAEITADRWSPNHVTTLLRLIVVSGIIIALTLRYNIVYQGSKLRSETQQQDRLQALQSRIRPHFLFNSMNSVASLIRSDPDLAEKALQDLADVFRVLLADARKMVPITARANCRASTLILKSCDWAIACK